MQLTTLTHSGGLLRYLGPPVLTLTGEGCPRALGLGSQSASEACFPSEALEGSLCVLSLLCEGHPRVLGGRPQAAHENLGTQGNEQSVFVPQSAVHHRPEPSGLLPPTPMPTCSGTTFTLQRSES